MVKDKAFFLLSYEEYRSPKTTCDRVLALLMFRPADKRIGLPHSPKLGSPFGVPHEP